MINIFLSNFLAISERKDQPDVNQLYVIFQKQLIEIMIFLFALFQTYLLS